MFVQGHFSMLALHSRAWKSANFIRGGGRHASAETDEAADPCGASATLSWLLLERKGAVLTRPVPPAAVAAFAAVPVS
jgi:hypothetical protein